MEGSGLHISLAAEKLGTLWGLPITNTILTAWVVSILLIIASYLIGKNPQLIPTKVQVAFEWLFETVFNFVEESLGTHSMAKRFFPLIATIFLFVLTANLFDFLPIVGSIGLWHGSELTPLFRPVNSDLNMTLALAIIAYLTIEITGIATLGFLKYGSKFVILDQGIIGFLVGLLELVSNTSRLISFSFRLFGNIFAGEVLLAVLLLFVPYVVPVPILAFETFVAFIQAAIFALLTLIFVQLAIAPPHKAEAEGH